jgi:predicted dehydrogenase
LKEAELIAVADISKRNLHFAKRMGIKNTYTNYEDLLKDERIQAVVICLPNFLHLESVVKAAEARKDIFLEKPLARNVEEGEEILSNVRRTGVKVMIGYDFRFNPVLRRLHEKIVGGFFGEVQIVHTANMSQGPFSAKSTDVGPKAVPQWWFDKELVGGGALNDLGSHLVDLLMWYFGEVVDARSYLKHMFNMEFEDSATCMLRFKNGPLATMNVGWFSKDLVQSIQVCGTANNVSVCMAPQSRLHLICGDIKKRLHQFTDDPYYAELRYFAECLRRDVNPTPSAEDGLSGLQVISAAYRNAHELTE